MEVDFSYGRVVLSAAFVVNQLLYEDSVLMILLLNGLPVLRYDISVD